MDHRPPPPKSEVSTSTRAFSTSIADAASSPPRVGCKIRSDFDSILNDGSAVPRTPQKFTNASCPLRIVGMPPTSVNMQEFHAPFRPPFRTAPSLLQREMKGDAVPIWPLWKFPPEYPKPKRHQARALKPASGPHGYTGRRDSS